MSTLINEFVKFIVKSCKIFVAVRNSLLTCGVQYLEPLLLQGRHANRAEPGTEPFELRKSLKHVVKLLDINASNRHSLSRGNIYETRPAQSPERFPDRCAGNPKLPANARLVKPRTRLNNAG